MPSFSTRFKALRRQSKVPVQPEDQTSNSSEGTGQTNRSVPTTNSSLTLDSPNSGADTPSSSLQHSLSNGNIAKLNGSRTSNSDGKSTTPVQRPSPGAMSINRYSLTGSMLQSPVNGMSSTKLPVSPYAPRVTSISENTWVHQKVLLVSGYVGESGKRPCDGHLLISHMMDTFPQTTWPVCDSHFKALVYLNPGPNILRFEFTSPKLGPGSTTSLHVTKFHINFLPLTIAPPLNLVILLGSDSPGTYDAVPERIIREGNDVETATKKFRMAAHLWQAFTGESMYRNSFGRRCFRYEEEWQPGTLSLSDKANGQMRNETKIHVIRSDKTVAELRKMNVGGHKNEGDGLYQASLDAVKSHFKPQPGQQVYAAVLLLDAHWIPQLKSIAGHAATGFRGGDGNVRIAIFGSQALQSYPTSMEEVVPALSDCTRTDSNHVANPNGEYGSNWEAANVGIGGHLQQVGHLFGCEEQDGGIMSPGGYLTFNRTFLTHEPYSTRTKSLGIRPCTALNEVTFHRLDALRLRTHPCFRMHRDPIISKMEDAVVVWPVDKGRVLVTARSGITFVELFADRGKYCQKWIDYFDAEGLEPPPQQTTLAEADLLSRFPEAQKVKNIRVVIHSAGGGKYEIENFHQMTTKSGIVKMPRGTGFRSTRVGQPIRNKDLEEELVLSSVIDQTKLLMCVKVYHDPVIYGIEFFYEDRTSQLFGTGGGKDPAGSQFLFDTRRAEIVSGFHVCTGDSIQGLEVMTSLGRRSGMFGTWTRDSRYTMLAPRGYTVAGLSGSCSSHIDGLSIVITR